VVGALAGLGGLAVLGVRGGRARDARTLRFTSHVPRTHGLTRFVYAPFFELVEARTGSRLRFESYMDGLLHGPLGGFKACNTGVTDYTHGYSTYQPGSFHLLHGLQLPLLFDSPAVASLVSEELYPTYFKDEYERMGVYLAHCDSTSPYNILSRTPIRGPDDLRGLKVRSVGGLTADVFEELGAVPIVMATSDVYVAFQRGVIDAVALGIPDMVSYRLQDIGTHLCIVDINVNVLQYCLNRSSFDALPDDLREELYDLFRIRSQIAAQRFYSGPPEVEARQTLRDEGIEVYEVPPGERENWRDRLAPLRDRFILSEEAEGRPAGEMVRSMETLARTYSSLSGEEIMQRVTDEPVEGIIDL
jgi:TRAP-type C4-dicarboxylate transport system substrate-binding protein